jgi:hypothetical protein
MEKRIMKTLSVFLCTMVLMIGAIGTANAALTTIGTATYRGSDYNLIYEDDSIGGGLVWLDYTNYNVWSNQVYWASSLNTPGDLTYNLNPGVSVTWEDEWRLPITDESQCNLTGGFGYEGPDASGYHDYAHGYNMVNSEMGHLYYESLGNLGFYATDGTPFQPGWGLSNTGDFNNLKLENSVYWSENIYSLDPDFAWYFIISYGLQGHSLNILNYCYAMAVRPGEVSVASVPIPSMVWLLGSGLIGVVGFRRKFRKA